MKEHTTLKSLRKQLISTQGKSHDEKIIDNLHNDNIRIQMDKLRKKRHNRRVQKLYFNQIEQLLHAKNPKVALDNLKIVQQIIHQIMIMTGTKNINQLSEQLSKQIKHISKNKNNNSDNNSKISSKESEAESKYNF